MNVHAELPQQGVWLTQYICVVLFAAMAARTVNGCRNVSPWAQACWTGLLTWWALTGSSWPLWTAAARPVAGTSSVTPSTGGSSRGRWTTRSTPAGDTNVFRHLISSVFVSFLRARSVPRSLRPPVNCVLTHICDSLSSRITITSSYSSHGYLVGGLHGTATPVIISPAFLLNSS